MLRAGIIGCGGIAERRHGPVLVNLKERVQIVAIADLSVERTTLLGEKFGIADAHRYSDWNRMLACESLDLVHICTPHHLHEPQAVGALEAGAHVLLEKPIATTLPEADRMIETAQRADRKITVNHNQLFSAEHRAVMQCLATDAIGQVFLVRSEGFGACHVEGRGIEQDWRTQSVAGGGGPLIDNGFHQIYRALDYVAAPVRRVYARVGRHIQNIEVEDMALLLLEHEGGATTSLQVGWCARAGAVGMQEIFGTAGQIRIGGEQHVGVWTEASQTWEAASVDNEGPDELGFPTLVDHFVTALEVNCEVPVTAAASRQTLEVVLAAYESGRTGKAVALH